MFVRPRPIFTLTVRIPRPRVGASNFWAKRSGVVLRWRPHDIPPSVRRGCVPFRGRLARLALTPAGEGTPRPHGNRTGGSGSLLQLASQPAMRSRADRTRSRLVRDQPLLAPFRSLGKALALGRAIRTTWPLSPYRVTGARSPAARPSRCRRRPRRPAARCHAARGWSQQA